jgi:hypothetical protein
MMMMLSGLSVFAMLCGAICRRPPPSPSPSPPPPSPSLTVYCTVQRAVDNLYTKLVVAYWQQTQVPGELELLESPSFTAHRRTQDQPAVVTLNEVPVAPSNQLALIQKLVVATLQQGAPPGGGAVLSAFAATHEDSEWLEDRDTEMC